jgi:hypothetical protein
MLKGVMARAHIVSTNHLQTRWQCLAQNTVMDTIQIGCRTPL